MTYDEAQQGADQGAGLPDISSTELLEASERADWALLRLVISACLCTVALAAASALLAGPMA
jgi:hypothetical protein